MNVKNVEVKKFDESKRNEHNQHDYSIQIEIGDPYIKEEVFAIDEPTLLKKAKVQDYFVVLLKKDNDGGNDLKCIEYFPSYKILEIIETS